MNKLQIARVAHEVNRAYCASLGDTTQPSWDDAAAWQRDSAIAGVEMHLADPDATPEQSHEAWLEQKVADGWTFGTVKDAEKKEHPCFLPYDELPAEQKAKDYLFRGVVHALSSMPQDVGPQPSNGDAAQVHGTEVQYIGRRETHTDGLYGTGSWTKGQTKVVPPALAAKMAKHGDVFKAGSTSATPAAAAAAALVAENPNRSESEEEIQRMDELKAQIGTMNKAGLRDFAKTHYQQQIDGRLSTEDTRAKVVALVNQYGPQ
ncbi:hypothetical protein J2W32_004474 [Variovorax boronicumulans]|uniref:Ryanodine receptor Ryr domain-containing protein n=1 Tax=Variovorax boronicumulans TaxID=436515 RepID=A0AAW8D6G1_9BURK|nr:RyR domain-containing protein [Variovorax boronicumulans]MDP9895376.1 hypothetical protein [Variovorax boronicumulans]MDQ0055416.1 hypothetical protein [Variovorax boronicumulans]